MDDFVVRRLNMKRKILIVDDEEINREILGSIVGVEYDVLYASNGKEALEVAAKEEGRLSLILLDILMPVMDGYEFFKHYQADEKLKEVPVIVLTSEKEAEVKALSMGAADFIPKPYDVPEVVLARIERVIQLYEDKNIITATQFDSLTGLFNREFFFEYSTIFDQYYPNDAKDLIAVNINRFHVINAMHGHNFGDQILAAVGKAIKQYVNDKHGIACRYNADSFYLYLRSGEHNEDIYNSISEALNDYLDDSHMRIRMGIYKNADRCTDIGKRLDYALVACNSIKGNYNVRFSYYDDTISEREHYEERLIRDLDKALESKQFKVFYQPKYAIQKGDPYLSSAEALVRWEHPELGMISPGVFIPLFENNGLISKLDRFVWKEAAEQVAKWKKDFGKTIPVSVNVSRVDMMNDGLVDEIKTIVNEAGISPKDYYLEVTESAYTDNQTHVLTIIDELRAEGFAIEMDDFGTGYSSLNMITTLHFDVLKLDMVFVKNMHTGDDKALMLVKFILDIAKNLGVKTIAEGVEKKEQVELLLNLGCDVIQGYYFSKPVCASEFEKFIQA